MITQIRRTGTEMDNLNIAPFVKWAGGKRQLIPAINERLPKKFDTYYEPFCGGASVLRRLLDSKIKVNNYICSDLNNGLISLWKEIKENPDLVSSHYRQLWNELNKDDYKQRKKEYFASVRERYNKENNPLDFMFIMRTVTNGMPRYNSCGAFNSSFHITRNGIMPEKLDKIIHEWSRLLDINNVRFISCSYEKINPQKRDFVYLDPPYANTKGMYYGCIDYEKFWEWLRRLPCGYVLSFDGFSGGEDNTWDVPGDIYSEHKYLLNGNSSFKRTTGNSKDSVVYESLYIK